jgi:hypothetical protein
MSRSKENRRDDTQKKPPSSPGGKGKHTCTPLKSSWNGSSSRSQRLLLLLAVLLPSKASPLAGRDSFEDRQIDIKVHILAS